ncbi:MAG TPA: AMP-binding protein [Sphingomonas sp.]|jgi:acyl-CoA synthetase (AMP-forming)/AMP-acid ligase II|uniref:class I adenylate-forming enzyme family protein n=1 Tax=Sphingomonas sp. TaxID=28214 RepID=UPI002EDB5C5B
MTLLVTDMIRLGAERHGGRVAVRFGAQELTFAQVDALSGRIAALLARDAAPGTAIGLLTNNGLFSVALDFACVKARLIRVPLNPRLSPVEHTQMLCDTGVRRLIHSDELADCAGALAAGIPGLAITALTDLVAEAADHDDRFVLVPHPDDGVLALYTSGTSGRLKAVLHSQASYAAITRNVLDNLMDPRPGDMMLHAASLIHASGTLVLPFWIRGGTAAILPGFVPAEYLDAVARWRPTALMLVPTMLAMLMDAPMFDVDRFDSVDMILYGASPMPRPLIDRALALFGPRFVQFFGQTEAPLAITVLTREDHLDPALRASCGRPARDCVVCIVDRDGVDQPAGQEGEVIVRAPFRMVGYHGLDALTADTLRTDGWLRTRDIGFLDTRGYLTLVDRASDMIVSGGYNVYPKEVEDALLTHAAVAEAIVVGIPSETWGEAVAAFVVLRDGAGQTRVDPADLIAHCRTRLAGYKIPRRIAVIDAIPKSAVGKPLRRVIRDPFWAGLARRI